jgi:hypothetical protein
MVVRSSWTGSAADLLRVCADRSGDRLLGVAQKSWRIRRPRTHDCANLYVSEFLAGSCLAACDGNEQVPHPESCKIPLAPALTRQCGNDIILKPVGIGRVAALKFGKLSHSTRSENWDHLRC